MQALGESIEAHGPSACEGAQHNDVPPSFEITVARERDSKQARGRPRLRGATPIWSCLEWRDGTGKPQEASLKFLYAAAFPRKEWE